MEEGQTYDAWRASLMDVYRSKPNNRRSSWASVGDWLFNSKGNHIYGRKNVCYHICHSNYNRLYHRNIKSEGNTLSSISNIEVGCLLCKTSVPDGIKMIALLEKL